MKIFISSGKKRRITIIYGLRDISKMIVLKLRPNEYCSFSQNTLDANLYVAIVFTFRRIYRPTLRKVKRNYDTHREIKQIDL